jgi:hypothetical protein
MSGWISPAWTGLPEWLCHRAADSRRGDLLLPRSPGQTDRVPGAVRADRGEAPEGHQGPGAGQCRPDNPVRGRGAQGRCDGPVPARCCRLGPFAGGGDRLCPGVPAGVDGAQAGHRSGRVPAVLLHQGAAPGVGVVRLHLGHRDGQRVHQDLQYFPYPVKAWV